MYFLKLYIIKQLKYFIGESFCISNKKHLLTLPNCLSSWMREPLPNEFVRLAWKAKVGYSWDRTATQRFWFNNEQRPSLILRKGNYNQSYRKPGGCAVNILPWPRWVQGHTCLEQRSDVSRISLSLDTFQCS